MLRESTVRGLRHRRAKLANDILILHFSPWPYSYIVSNIIINVGLGLVAYSAGHDHVATSWTAIQEC
jgi:hypothetical protein